MHHRPYWLTPFILSAVLAAGCSEANKSVFDDPFAGDAVASSVDGNAYSKDSGVSPGGTVETPGPGACVPDCFGKACGDDGCGGTCGDCLSGFHCSGGGLCISDDCIGNCQGKVCGDDGCGESCGECGPGMSCSPQGFCVNGPCVGNCQGMSCGDDGCGQSCGACGEGQKCTALGQCIAEDCNPSCFGKQCGDDGCGGQCGKCAPNEVCNGNDQCEVAEAGCGGVPESGVCEGNTVKWCFNNNIYTLNCDPNVGLVCGWNDTQNKFDCVEGSCNPSCVGKQCGPDGCGGKCGICPAGESCKPTGVCEANCIANCAGKQCGPNGCGGSCGNCPNGQVCGGTGKCQAGNCVPNCVGKQCGPDGCGGKCGICPAGESCKPGGTCQAGGCTPDCVGKQCGANGCGGSCGNCPQGKQCGPGFKCLDGPCLPNCQGKQCGSNGCGGLCGQCPNGQSCSPQGSCQAGPCIPQCAGKQCGADGCGSSCGVCGEGLSCQADGLCADASGCVQQCAGKDCGPDSCGGKCGICGAGLSCNGEGLCTPSDVGGECGDIDFTGVCEEDVLKYCSGGELVTIDCAEQELTCGWQPENEWFDCVEPGSCTPDCGGGEAGPLKVCGDDGCGGSCGACAEGTACSAGQCVEGGGECGEITYVGECDGNMLKYCAGDALKLVNCAEQGKSCGFDEGSEWYDCLDAPPDCTPDCVNKNPGDADGCGGVCGGGPAGECGDVDTKGKCDGNTLLYCAGDQLQVYECDDLGKVCGYAAENDWYDCIDGGGPCTPDCADKADGEADGCGGLCGGGDPGGGCGEIDAKGACDGDTLKYCAAGELKSVDCTANGQTCGFVENFDWYDCVDGDDPGVSDGCGDIDQTGVCEGDTLKYCAGENLVTVDCSTQGKTCGFDEQYAWNDCVEGDDPGPDPGGGCGEIDAAGTCEGNTLKYCSGDQIAEFDCTDFGKTCGYDDDMAWYDCLEGGGPCVPDCANKNPGDPDGCGGTCQGPGGGCGDVDTKGHCQDNTLEYCSGGQLVTIDCTQYEKTCGYDAQFDWFDCIEGDAPCVPDCAGKNEGDPDGCGGSCAGDPGPGGCGDIDYTGKCDGDTLTYCSNGELATVDCTEQNKVCGFVDEFEWFDCVDSGGPCTPDCDGVAGGESDGCGGLCPGDPDPGACGAITEKGACDGNTLQYCSSGELKTFDCASFDKVCGFDEALDWFDCIEGDGGGDPGGVCGGIDQAGVCEGTVLKYCSAGELQEYDCTDYGKSCGFVDDMQWFDCVEDPDACTPDCVGKEAGEADGCGGQCEGGPIQTCDEVGVAGACDGTQLSYCANGNVVTVDCADSGKVCDFDPQYEWYDCLEGECTPSCAGQVCGGDGCGGSCGDCAAGFACEVGQCVESSGGCGGVSTQGECDGNTLKYCSGGELKTFDCSEFNKICGFEEQFDWYDCIEDPAGCVPDCNGKNCGDDGCGGSCGGCPDGQTCDAGLCTANGACGGVTTQGECDGDTLKYCSGGELKTFDCAEFGKTCGFDEQYDWYDCIEGSGECTPSCAGSVCGSDGCGGSCGNCLAGQSCESGQCVGGDNGSCGNVTSKGKCEGNTLSYCSGGELETFDCTSFNKVCEYDPQFDWFDCVEDGGGSCTPNCAGAMCGDDGCGGSCGGCDIGLVCSGGQCVPDGGGGSCGGIDSKGTCEGNTLEYCASGELKTFDCAEYDKICGFDETYDWYDCLENPDTCTPSCGGKQCGSDGCGGSCGTCSGGESCDGSGQCVGGGGACGDLTNVGECQGDTLKYCSGGEVKTFDCTAFGKVCAFDDTAGWYDCVEGGGGGCTPSCSGVTCGSDGCGGSCGTCPSNQSCNASGQCVADDNCGGVDNTGECQGNTLKYCSNGELQSFNCTSYGKICGYDNAAGWYDCIEDPDACTPSCGGAECGSDGCGGSCGTCSGGDTCQSGQCVDPNPGGGGSGCGSITYEGTCEGNTLKYCDGGTLQTIDCAQYAGTCYYDSANGYYDCKYD